MTEWLASLPDGVVIFEGDGPWWDLGSVLESAAVATLHRLVVVTPDVGAGMSFYRDVLGGEVAGDHITWDGGEILLHLSDGVPRVGHLEVTGHLSTTIGGVPFVEV